jgi:DNA modification methylase
MAIVEQTITDRYALYLGDCMEVMPTLPAESVHLSLYSPPFAGLYHYSSSDRDMSNARSYEEFEEHYRIIIDALARLTVPGRMTAVHCADLPTGNTGLDALRDFPGDIIRWHRDYGFDYVARYHVWKEPFKVRMRTLMKGLAHRTVVEDSSRCTVAAADYLLVFRKRGENPIPIAHPTGLMEYAGARRPPADILSSRGHTDHLQNRFSHWVWRQYASAFWDDVRIDRVLPFQAAKDTNDERHIHPLQLDVIDRALVLWSNPDEVVLTPFMGVGSEVYGAINAGRKAVGIELKPTYYRQAVRNVERAHLREGNQEELSTVLSDDGMDEVEFDEGERNLVSRSGRWLGKS